MQICCVNAWDAQGLGKWKIDGADLVVFGGDGQTVDYQQELRGDTCFFQDATMLSKRLQSVVVCGCTTNTRGVRRKSAMVAQDGRLLGVSDGLHALENHANCGATLRVYETKIGKMGVAVAEDLLFPDVFKTLALCGSQFVVCTFGDISTVHAVLARAHAYCFGTPILLCGNGYCQLADEQGNVSFASHNVRAMVALQPKPQYRIVRMRKKGLF